MRELPEMKKWLDYKGIEGVYFKKESLINFLINKNWWNFIINNDFMNKHIFKVWLLKYF